MKYSITQYAHDSYRLNAIEAEIQELRQYKGKFQWVGSRMAELQRDRLEIVERMFRYERHPNNR